MVDEAMVAALELGSGATSFAESMSEDNLDGGCGDEGGGQRLGPAARRRVRKKKRRSGSLSRYSWVPGSAGGAGKKMRYNIDPILPSHPASFCLCLLKEL